MFIEIWFKFPSRVSLKALVLRIPCFGSSYPQGVHVTLVKNHCSSLWKYYFLVRMHCSVHIINSLLFSQLTVCAVGHRIYSIVRRGL